jgi:CubicO group peptidase (beta-lactamase class C family)
MFFSTYKTFTTAEFNRRLIKYAIQLIEEKFKSRQNGRDANYLDFVNQRVLLHFDALCLFCFSFSLRYLRHHCAMEKLLSESLVNFPEVPGVSIAVVNQCHVTPYVAGFARVKENELMTESHYLQCASLSKTVATAFAIEYLAKKGINFQTAIVNQVLEAAGSTWRIQVSPSSSLSPSTADRIVISQLVNHTALGMHYVYGIPLDEGYPGAEGFLTANPLARKYKYTPLFLEREPGTSFSYSGGGYVVLEHLIECLEGQGRTVNEISRPFLDACGLTDFAFAQLALPLQASVAYGHITPTQEVNPQLAFPAFAAGALCTAQALATFLVHLSIAYHCPVGSGAIQQSTARMMLGEESLVDLGCREFMGARMGLGVFVAQAGATNRLMLHQAANDGYRGIYMLGFDGPDAGKGFVILCNGDNPAVLMISSLCRKLLEGKKKSTIYTV